jgi:chromosome segregation ATPase
MPRESFLSLQRKREAAAAQPSSKRAPSHKTGDTQKQARYIAAYEQVFTTIDGLDKKVSELLDSIKKRDAEYTELQLQLAESEASRRVAEIKLADTSSKLDMLRKTITTMERGTHALPQTMEDIKRAKATLNLDDCSETTLDEVKEAYQRLARQHHPDKNGTRDVPLDEITRAKNILVKYLETV